MTDIKCVHVPFLLESATELASKEQTEDKLGRRRFISCFRRLHLLGMLICLHFPKHFRYLSNDFLTHPRHKTDHVSFSQALELGFPNQS